MEVETLHGLWTLLLLALFVGIVIWAYSRRRKADFEKAARIPLEDDRPPPDKD